MPKCEIIDRSDFLDFYTLKSPWEGDFRVNYLFIYLGVHLWPRNSYAYAQSNFKEDLFSLGKTKMLGSFFETIRN